MTVESEYLADRELIELCELVCTGSATEQQSADLEQRMLAGSEAANVYLNYAALHADLLQITSALHGRRAVIEYVETRRSYWSNLAGPSARLLAGVGAAAATLLVVFATYWMLGDNQVAMHPSSRSLPEIDGMAVISGIDDVVWSEPSRVFEVDQLLRSEDWVAFESGHVEIEFGQGAVVVLEGPARFAARSTSVGQLEYGKLAAVVPPWADGFRVDTSSVRVVDRGTKFELNVTRDQRVDVAVTKGEVELFGNGANPDLWETPTRLVEGQAARAEGDRVEQIIADEALRTLTQKLPPRPDHTEVEVVARYRRDFVKGVSNRPRSSGQWQYLVNSWAPIGGAEGYSELIWDSRREVYDPNGDQDWLAGSRLHAANLSHRGGHPGSGKDQTKNDQDHYVIAAYDVPRDGVYRIESGWLVRFESREDIANQAVDLVVHINEDPPIYRETCSRDGLLRFGGTLGLLNQGDRIYVAVGPHGVDHNDRFEWDFAIVRMLDRTGSIAANAIAAASTTTASTTAAWVASESLRTPTN